jgi:hypothetical protein
VSEVAAVVASIEERVDEILGSLGAIERARATESERLWTALGSLSGLDGIAGGLAEVGELLAPLRQLVPPTTAQALEPGVAGALASIRTALGTRRDTNFATVTTDWDGPVDFIGVAVPDRAPDPDDVEIAVDLDGDGQPDVIVRGLS